MTFISFPHHEISIFSLVITQRSPKQTLNSSYELLPASCSTYWNPTGLCGHQERMCTVSGPASLRFLPHTGRPHLMRPHLLFWLDNFINSSILWQAFYRGIMWVQLSKGAHFTPSISGCDSSLCCLTFTFIMLSIHHSFLTISNGLLSLQFLRFL